MADTKITALAAITTVDPAADVLPIVDISDTSMAASGTTKKITSNQILGAGGTATLASATITGAATAASLTVTGSSIPTNGLYLPTTNTLEFAANSLAQYRIAPLGVFSWYDGAGGTRMTLNSTGLGVGVTPSAWNSSVPAIQVKGVSGIYGAGSSEFGMTQNNFYNASGQWIYGTTAAAGRYSISAGVHAWYTATSGTINTEITQFASAKMALDASGNLTVANGNVILGTSGKGIDFSATASGSGTMTSELLNDYEEGTFTPTVVGSTTAGTATYSAGAQNGYYTKVGRLVTVQVYMVWSGHTGTGNMRFAGLPFNTANITSNYASVSFGLVSNIALTAI